MTRIRGLLVTSLFLFLEGGGLDSLSLFSLSELSVIHTIGGELFYSVLAT